MPPKFMLASEVLGRIDVFGMTLKIARCMSVYSTCMSPAKGAGQKSTTVRYRLMSDNVYNDRRWVVGRQHIRARQEGLVLRYTQPASLLKHQAMIVESRHIS